ncbi:Gamma-glutamyltranspeptidase 1 [Chamberlinius hualienensis]
MESNPARSSSYTKLNDWNQGKRTPLVARRSKLSKWKRIFVVFVIALCIVFIGVGIGFGLSKINHKRILSSTRPFVDIYREGAVSSQSPNCSLVGRDILKANGSAVDAAIAAMLCEGVYSPQSAGLGGGFFMLVYTKKDNVVSVIDARETAPASAKSELYKEPGSTLRGGLAVAVPGELRGYELAHRQYGRLNWSDLFQPAIKFCREGITISSRLGYSLTDGYKEHVLNSSTLRSIFVRNDTGKVLETGDVYYCHKLSETLEIIAEQGADALYTGELGKLLLNDLKEFGSIITEDDLKNYKVAVREPTEFTLSDGIAVSTMPPPGGGLVLGLLLQILDKISLNATYEHEEIDDMQWAHYFAEACKYAYAKRAEIGDPDLENMKELIALMTSPNLAERIRNSIQDETFGQTHYDAMFISQSDHGTAHVSVLAPNGDAVTITSTINTGFGAMIRSPSTGIILNNEMDDFSLPLQSNIYDLPPAPVNFIKPGKRPASSMAPAFVFDSDGELLYVLGASGGSRIVSAIAYVYMMHEYRNKSFTDSLTAKRLHHQLYPNTLQYENGFDPVILQGLNKSGHSLKMMNNLTLPSVYLIYRNTADRTIVAGSDPRRDSAPAGF